MLKRMFALSDQGSRDLNKGIAATTLSNLCLIAPVSLLVMVIWELLNVISGQESSMRDHAALFICGTVVMFIIVFLTQWLQYNKTYTVAYKESANRRIVLAEKLRKLPLSFFGQRDLSDLTTTIMGDCTALERVFSNAIPQLFGTIFMFIITAIGLPYLPRAGAQLLPGPALADGPLHRSAGPCGSLGSLCGKESPVQCRKRQHGCQESCL